MPPPPRPPTARRLPAGAALALALGLAAFLHIAACLLVALAYVEACLRPRARKAKPRGVVVADDGAFFAEHSVLSRRWGMDPPAVPASPRPPTPPTGKRSMHAANGAELAGRGRAGACWAGGGGVFWDA